MADYEARIDLGIRGLGPAEHIGRGGFADVYKAEQISLRRTVAVKVLRAQATDEDAEARFERECHAIGAVSDHPHIVGVHEGGFTRNGRAYLVMEYLPGGSLREYLDDHGPLPVERVVDTGIKIARALAEAHRAGVLHRDVKPANIMISAYGEPALGDFGIARIEGGHQTATGLVTASFAHAAPEVLEGMAPTASADVYSLGTTVFELLVGRPPYYSQEDESIWPLMKRILSEPMPSPESVGMSRQLGRVFERATNRDPGLRYTDVDAMADELMALSGDPLAMTTFGSAAPGRADTKPGSANDPDETSLIAGAPPVVGTPGGPPAPKPDLTSLHNVDAALGSSTGKDDTGRFTQVRPATAFVEAAPPAYDPPPAYEPSREAERRGAGGKILALVLGLTIIAGAAAVGLVLGRNGATDGLAAAGTSAIVAAVHQADTGPLDVGSVYEVVLGVAADGSQYRLVVDGEPVGAPVDQVPEFVADEGRHTVAVEISNASGVETTDPIDYYGLADGQSDEYVANLDFVETSAGWPAVLERYDRLVANGHDRLAISSGDRLAGFSSDRWVLYVPGFGNEALAAEEYCEDAELSIPSYCYVGFHQP